MQYCSECRFFTDDGRCLNPRKRGTDVGYFQKACPKGEPVSTEAAPVQDAAPVQEAQEQEAVKTKRCPCCGRELPLDRFSKHRRHADGLQVYCKDCVSQNAKRKKEKKEEKKAQHTEEKKAHRTEEKKKPAPAAAPSLHDWSVRELVEELERRGYQGTIEKCSIIIQTSNA